MIRPLTFLSLVAAAGAGLHLYGVKHEVSQLEKTLRETVRQTEAARERTAVLRAEWALLNEPERLRTAATRNLPLEVMQTTQFVRPSELERRLPAAVSFAGAPSLFGPPPSERPGASNGVAVASAAPANAAPASTNGAAPAAVNSAAPAATNSAARLVQATPAVQPAPKASVSVVPLPATAPRAPAQVAAAAPARPAPAERMPVPTAERAAPVRAPQAQVAALRAPEPHAPEPKAEMRSTETRETAPRLAETPRVATRLAAPTRPAASRLAERAPDREVDRGMNLASPPQAPALLRTALHMRSTT
ncbi:MAG TPA: hypothetical protein VIL69_21785, partial [Roseomonas sp.]